MSLFSSGSKVTLQGLTDFSNLEKHVKDHLQNVYVCMTFALMSAAAGSYVHIFTRIVEAGFLVGLLSIGLLIWLGATEHKQENLQKRMLLLIAFAFCTGVGLGPLVEHAARIDPSIVPTAFLGTCMIFFCFSLTALWARDRAFLYLGGILGSAMMWLLGASLLNIFFRSRLLFQVEIYIGLAIFCAFILYDTQLIVEKRRRGDDDYIWHCIDLFLDFIAIFRRLLVILSNKEDKKKRRND